MYESFRNNCSRSYIGQTNRRMSVRFEEHKQGVSQGLSTSALVQQVKEASYSIDFMSTTTIAKIKKLMSRVAREAIEIEKTATLPKCQR